jgi:hypothetical protein
MRNLKVLGKAALALLAVSAIAASSAFATYDQAAKTATLSGSQTTKNVFTTDSGTVKCAEATFSGNGIGTTAEPTAGITTFPEVTFHPVYSGCTAFGLAAEYKTTGCNWVLTTATTTTIGSHATVHFECEAGKQIEIISGGGACLTKIPAQTPGGVVKLLNEPAGKVTAIAEVSGVSYSQAGPGCTGGDKSDTNGTFTGSILFEGKNGGAPVNISVT